LPRTGPVLWKTKRPCPRTKWLFEGPCFAVRGAVCHPGAQGPVAESRERNGHGCQRPSCGHGSGPTGNCMPEMPDCDQPRRASPCASASCKALQRSSEKTAAITSFRSTQSRSKRCAHAKTRPALTQVVSQKKGESYIADCSTTFPRLSRVGELRNREDAANVRAFFELRFAENCAEPRPACVSALLRLLKACESSLKKPSACTTCGASLLNFREVLRVALAGLEFLLFYKSAITLVSSGADFPSLRCGARDGAGPGANG
jgi:hypothetical protein